MGEQFVNDLIDDFSVWIPHADRAHTTSVSLPLTGFRTLLSGAKSPRLECISNYQI